jgi:hypothetical protein
MENDKQTDVMAILKLYELRRDPVMREARQWYFTEFRPTSGKDIVRLDLSGERESANFRMVTSFWDMACSFVNNGAIDEKIFADANTEHLFVYAVIQPHLAEVRELFGEPDYLENLEKFVLKLPHVEKKLENRRLLMAKWAKEKTAS